MKMHKVKRAIIMAAGIGKRMQPVTFTIPKPMVKVNGTRMIDTVIDALHDQGIYEIIIVVGYLKEQFEILKTKYDGITIVENPYYNEFNNISSLYVAREYLEDVIILDGDQIIYDSTIVRADYEKSGYNAVWTEGKTDEWLMQVDNGKVISCSRDGGEKGWQLYSISRWTSDDGKKLRKYLEYEFEVRKNSQIYWDDVAMFFHFEDFDLGIMEMSNDSIVEIDNYEDLVAIDKSYATFK